MCRVIGLCLGWVIASAAGFSAWADVAPAEQPPATVPIPQNIITPGSTVAIIPIKGDIYSFTLDSLKRRVDRALANGAKVIVIELDTNGGVATDALDISRYIKQLPVPTVAWVNPKAYSAGIIIAAACDLIVMADASVTGDAAPIVLGQNLSETERAKALSPILADFYDSAETNGLSYAVLKATCVLDAQVYQVKHTNTGEEKFVNQADYQVMVNGLTHDEAVKAVTPTTGPSPVGVDAATAEDAGKWKLVKQVHDGRTLLTVNDQRAKDLGISQSTVSSQADLEKWLATTKILSIEQSWSEDLAGYLLHPIARGILIALFMLGLYMELQTPGLGLPGALAATCLLVLLGSPFLVGLSGVWHLIVFFVGLILLVVEIFITPGFGVMGVSGIILMLAALILGPIPTGGNRFLPPREVHPLLAEYAIVSLIFVAVAICGIMAMMHFFGSSAMFNRFILRDRQLAGVGALAGGTVSGSEAVGLGKVHIGDTGSVVAPLRPTGRVELGGEVIDAASRGEWVDAGTRVRVVEVQGSWVVVEAA